MESYYADIDPEQVVRWIRTEQKNAPSALGIEARCTTEVRELPIRKELHLGDDEREDLSEIVKIGTLEIAPARQSDGWRLSVVVENEAAPHISDGNATEEPEHGIDLAAFYREFMLQGAGTANVIVETADSAGEARVRDLLDRIERNYHGSTSLVRGASPARRARLTRRPR